VIVGTGKNSDCFWDSIVFDTGHVLAALRTDRTSGRNSFGFREDGVDVFCGFNREEIGHVRGKKMTTTVEAFVNSLSITVDRVYGNEGKRVTTVRTSHVFILANIGSDKLD